MRLISSIFFHINRISSIAAISLALLLGYFSVALALDATNPTNRRILSIATTAEADTRRTELLMERLGYPPSEWSSEAQQWRNFKQWPLERKIETAWLSAEEARSGDGNRFLNELAKEISKYNHAITSEPELKTFFAQDSRPTEKAAFRFVAPWDIPAEKVAAGAPPEVRKIVTAVAKHAGSYPGGTLHLVSRCCNIPESTAWELLRKSSSIEEALHKAVEIGDLPPEKAERIAQLLREGLNFDAAISAEIDNPKLREVMRQYVAKGSNLAQRHATAQQFDLVVKSIVAPAEAALSLADDVGKKATEILENIPTPAASKTSAFEAVHAAVSPDIPDIPIPDISGANGNVSSTKPKARPTPSVASAAYRSFQVREYGGVPTSAVRATSPSASRHAFRSIIRTGRGFGGIVFGNVISSSDTMIAKPLAFTWHKLAQQKYDDGEERGILIFVLEDGTRAYSPPMFASDLIAAVRAVYGLPDGMEPLSEGQGLGLAGYTGRINAYEIVDGVVSRRDAVAASFLVHPTMARSELGKAAIVVDAMPFLLKDWLKERAQQDDISPEQRQKLKAWLDTEWTTYKFIDVPLEVKIDEQGVIHTSRSDGLPKGASESLRDSSFVTKVIFSKDDGSVLENSDEIFYPISPEFSVISKQFARINDFAQIFGLVRWAKSMNADVLKLPEITDSSTEWSTIVIERDGSGIELGTNKHVRALVFAAEVEKAAQGILQKDDSLAILKPISADILKNRSAQVAIDFLLETNDQRVILNTHLDQEQVQTIEEQVSSNSEAMFERRFRKLRESIVQRAERGEFKTIGAAIEEIQMRGAVLAADIQEAQFQQALQETSQANQELDADLKRFAALQAHRKELAHAYEFTTPLDFLRSFGQAPLQEKRNDLLIEREHLQEALDSGEHSIALRYEFSPENVKAELSSAVSGYESAGNWLTRKFYEWKLSDLPALDVAKVKKEISALTVKIAEADTQLAALPSLEIANHGAFKEWFRLQRSYATECKSGVCL
jgi:hypothetical protein